MKLLPLLLALALPVCSVHALDPSIFDEYAPLTPALTQLFTDLEAIPAGSAITDAQREAIAADLAALPPGPSAPPDAAALDLLAADLGAAAAAGLIDGYEEYWLAYDLTVDPEDPDSWFVYLRDEVTYLLEPPVFVDDPGDGTVICPGDGTGVFIDPETGIAYPIETIFTTTAVARTPIPSGRFERVKTFSKRSTHQNQKYAGRAEWTAFQAKGAAAATTLKVSAQGLPAGRAYTLNATLAPVGATVAIGKLRPRGSTFGAGHPKRPLPEGLQMSDVSALTVTDAEGKVWLTLPAEAGARRSVLRRTHLRLTGGTMRAAVGQATARLKERSRQAARYQFRFSARNLPANTAVTLVADGRTVGAYTTNAKGRLTVSSREADLSSLQTLSVLDAQGSVLLRGSL